MLNFSRLLVVSILVGYGCIASAKLPTWVETRCKQAAFEHFVTVTGVDTTFFRIRRTEVIEEVAESGQPMLSVSIFFDDSKGCFDRFMRARCIPFDLNNQSEPLFMTFLATDCIP